MKRFTKIVVLLMLAMLLVGASIASASVELPDSSGTHRARAQTTSSYDYDDDDYDDDVVDLEDATVPWEVPSLIGGPDESQYQCSDIPEGLEIVPA